MGLHQRGRTGRGAVRGKKPQVVSDTHADASYDANRVVGKVENVTSTREVTGLRAAAKVADCSWQTLHWHVKNHNIPARRDNRNRYVFHAETLENFSA